MSRAYDVMTFPHTDWLAPSCRHNGGALSVMKACISALPNANSIAYFDTSFHSTMAPCVSMYMIRQDIAKKRGLKKYGFHGLSCKNILIVILF